MKTIRFKQDYIYSRKGDVIHEGDGVAEILIMRNIAEEVDPKDVQGEQTEKTAPPAVVTRRIPGPRENNNGRERKG